MKSLQKKQNSTNLLLWPPICRNKPAITPKWFNFLETNSNSISRRIQIFGKTLPVTLGSIHLWTMIIIFLLTYYNRNLIRFFLNYICNLMRWKSRKHFVKLHINYEDNSYLNALNSVDEASCFSNQNIERHSWRIPKPFDRTNQITSDLVQQFR